MEDANKIELLIFKLHKAGREPSVIADELLKLWDKNLISFSGKISAGKFCILNGFFLSLISVFRKDLRGGYPSCWPLIFQTIVSINKEVIDACLIGAGVEQNLIPLAVAALEKKDKDPRWIKIFAEDEIEKNKKREEQKEKLLTELKIFETEKMKAEAIVLAQKLNQMFPHDSQIKNITSRFDEWELAEKLDSLRKKYPAIRPGHIPGKLQADPQFKKEVLKAARKLDMTGVYDLSVAMHTMELNALALECLRTQKNAWTLKELLFELELLVEIENFAEALELSQKLLKKYSNDFSVVNSCIYNMARCYYGLKDMDQALNTLKALYEHHPDYRNTKELILLWEKEI